jgi:hypothetical protein
VLGQAGDQRVDRAVRVGRLTRRPQRQLAGDAFVVGDAAAGLHRCRVHAGVDDVFADDDVGLRKDCLGRRFVTGLPVEAVVVLLSLEVVANQWRVGGERLARVHHRRQDVPFDFDEFERISCGVAIFGDDESDFLALEPGFVGDEHRLHVVRQGRHPGQTLLGQHGAGHHRLDLRVRRRRGGVDTHQPSVRCRRAQDCEVQHARQLDVIDVVPHAANETRVFLAQHAAVADRLLVVVHEPGGAIFDGGHAGLPAVTGAPAASGVAFAAASVAAAHLIDRTIVV